MLHPLHTSICCTTQEPLSFKGGIGFPLDKGLKGQGAHVAPGYREIMLASVVGKHYYIFVRSRVLSLARNLFLEAQTGGISGRSTDFSAIFLRAHVQRLQLSERCGLALFADIKQAF
eukprot:2966580-Karenia_brevis.AAC.1